jgi:hypothetical protein
MAKIRGGVLLLAFRSEQFEGAFNHTGRCILTEVGAHELYESFQFSQLAGTA